MLTVTDQPDSASELRALADLARIGTATREALAIIDGVSPWVEGSSAERWRARVDEFFPPAKSPIIKRWVVYALASGLDPGTRDDGGGG